MRLRSFRYLDFLAVCIFVCSWSNWAICWALVWFVSIKNLIVDFLLFFLCFEGFKWMCFLYCSFCYFSLMLWQTWLSICFFIWSCLHCIVLWSYSDHQRRKGKRVMVKEPNKERWMFLPEGCLISIYLF